MSSPSQQRRTLFGRSTQSNSYLAHIEQSANNNPASASAQYAFYSASLRAGRPDIVVSRYESGHFASNQQCEQIYAQAAERLGLMPANQQQPSNQASPYQSPANTNADQRRAIAQAVVAQNRGSPSITTNSPQTGSNGVEAFQVIVKDSRGNLMFKWAKMIVTSAVWVYVIIMALSLFAGFTGLSGRPGGRGKMHDPEARAEMQTTRFSDVHGCDEAKEELVELVEFLKAPDQFSRLGGRLPKGVLLVGPPGTGKTLLAKAVAGEAGVPFFYMSGSEFDEIYVGVGAKRMRELFASARGKAPSIVFIDEIDAVGGKRNDRDAAYVKQTLNQLLTELDGFDPQSGVIFIAATNLPQLLDKALLRPGRFDRQVHVTLPDVRGRVAILKHHMRKLKLNNDVDAAVIARGTPGCSGAELENIVNQAAIHASKNKGKDIAMNDFEWAKDRIMMGAERRSAIIQKKDKLMTAYHEGGHALVALLTKDATPLYKATIMPRGHALGITFSLPEMDKVSQSKREYLASIDVCMGGKVAEEMIYGLDDVTSGASSDLSNATSIAYAMVTKMGFSESLGDVDYNSIYADLAPHTKQRIDDEVRKIIRDSKQRVTTLLTDKRKELELLANALLEYESLTRAEMEKVVNGEKLPEKMLHAEPQAPIKLPEVKLALPPLPTPPGPTPSQGDGPSLVSGE
jgi:ATP-dependent metalloprotease